MFINFQNESSLNVTHLSLGFPCKGLYFDTAQLNRANGKVTKTPLTVFYTELASIDSSLI